MRAVLLISLLLGASILTAATHSASPTRQSYGDGAPRVVGPRPPIALEQPGNPPGLNPPQPPHRFVRSAVTYSRGPWVSIQANVDEFGNNIPDDAANEPSIAVHPNAPDKIAIGWRQFDTIDSNFRQAGWGYSQDGGQSWTFPGVIEPGVFRSDPVLGFSNDGEFYYYSLTTDFNDVWECHLFKSIDGGVSWNEGVFAFGGDKAWLAVDRTGGSGHGHIYAKWQTFFNCCGQSTFTRSIDGASSFEDAVPVPLGPSFGVVNVGPDGAVYVAGIWAVDFQDFNRIVIARSSDAQNPAVIPTFDLAVDVDLGGHLDIGAAPNPNGLAGQVWVATDHSGGPTHGNVYILASVDPPGSDLLDVMFIRSTDGGQSWTSPIRVNDDPTNSGAWQWFGTISVAPNGRIDVIWNDTRTAGQANISELFYAYSTDAGDTWSPNMPVSPAFDSHVGWPQQNKLGDYYDMISDAAGVRIAYAATFNGEQDVYYLRLGDCDDNGIHDGEEIAGGAPDDNANGILDVCESGACCLGDGACDGELEEACLAAGGVYQGDDIDCGAVECAPFGACCTSDGSCSDLQSPADCAAAGGLYQGDTTDCASANCVPFGACCTAQGSCLDDQTEAGCLAAGGLYQDDGTDCASVDCAPFGACCLPDESCMDQQTAGLCAAANGDYQGPGTLCTDAGVDCTIPSGACCMSDFSCNENTTEADCAAAGGSYFGDGSDCTECSEEPVACCDFINGECVGDLGPSKCVALGFEPQEAGTSCASTDCPILLGACCMTDGSCDDAMSIPECEAAAGSFQGDGVTCTEVECAQPPTGACCLASGDCLEDLTADACTVAGGDYAGDYISCFVADCPSSPPTGSCCLNDSVCAPDATADACALANGVYLGDGSDCTFCSVSPQACCTPITGACADQPPAQCIDQGLEPQGPDTNCDNTDCGVTGACCLADDSCSEVNAETCAVLEGAYGGDGSTCDPLPCPMVACPEDLDGDGAVGPFDLALVLGFWGPCPEPCAPGPPATTCQTDLDGDCATGPFDLALILGFWGPCE